MLTNPDWRWVNFRKKKIVPVSTVGSYIGNMYGKLKSGHKILVNIVGDNIEGLKSSN